MITTNSIWNSYNRIKNLVRKTPLEHSPSLSILSDADIFLKMECWQHTGSFKIRGAYNCLLSLSEKEKIAGVLAPTAGNHGIGLAFAARELGIPVHIYLPEDTDISKLQILEKLKANVVQFPDIETARINAIEDSKKKGLKFLSAYNEKGMIEGGASVGIEILQDLSDVDIVMVCVGGGGLISGISTILKANNPYIEIWGVQSENSPTFIEWFGAGETIPVELSPSIASGLSGYIEPETITFPIVMENVDRMISISEQDLIDGMKFMAETHQQIVEPSGVASVSALLNNRVDVKGKKVVAVVTGRNISFTDFNELIR